MTKAGVLHQVSAVVAGGLLLAGCGQVAASSAHGARATPRSRTTHHATPHTASAHATQAATVGWRHLSLPSAMDIRAIRAGSGSDVTLVLGASPDASNPHGVWATVSYNWRTGALGAETTIAAPTLSVTTSYQLVSSASGPPWIRGGPGTAPLAWPASIPTYTSGENPAGNQFGVDNAVIGQTGQWLWAALKGPKNSPTTAIPLVWGYRHWDRLVALNRATGHSQVYPIPPELSSALYGPLWLNAPVFSTLASGDGLVAVGHWVAVVPADPGGVASLPTLGPPPVAAAADERAAVALLTRAAWSSIDADAAFWNCYVMADPNQTACPQGASVFGGSALSMQPTYFNHGSVGFSLLWAITLPMSSASEQQARTTAENLMARGLAGSYLMAWIGSPSAAALRSHYQGQPPHSLPGYTRRQGYYWATTAGG